MPVQPTKDWSIRSLRTKSVGQWKSMMLVQSPIVEQHIKDLTETFASLHLYNMRLNPEKCTFGVETGKFLGFMVSQRGIEINPEKIWAILELPSPKSVKDIQRLAGRIATLNRFISKSADKCLLFFKLLRNSTRFVWDEQCEKAFVDLKTYLSSPPLLVSPEVGEKLYLYLATSEETLAVVLIKETRKRQFPIYYVSKALHDFELNYSKIEKLAYSLIMASRKLRQYFQSHPITVLIDQPLKEVLQRMTTSGQMVKWSIELSEYGL